jgi:hypothetical protein
MIKHQNLSYKWRNALQSVYSENVKCSSPIFIFFTGAILRHNLLQKSQLFVTKSTEPVTVAERSEACTVFARSEAGIVGSNPNQGMDIWCVCAFFCVCVVLCLGRGLATSWSPVQGVLPSVNDQETEKLALCSKSGSKLPKWEQRGRKKIYWTEISLAKKQLWAERPNHV